MPQAGDKLYAFLRRNLWIVCVLCVLSGLFAVICSAGRMLRSQWDFLHLYCACAVWRCGLFERLHCERKRCSR